MLHEIPTEELGARGHAMAAAVQSCVHCGFCLPTCPTYRVLGQETDSPRGRILLMKEVLEGKVAAEDAQIHIDRCLGCLACETSCPSGVKYGELLSPYRAMRRQEGVAGGNRLRRWLAALTLPYPNRFRWAMRLGKLGRALRFMTPSVLHPMLDLVPSKLPAAQALPAFTPAQGERRATVALLVGCAQQVLAPRINAAAIRVLSRNGCDVHVPNRQGCCGALSWHIGDDRQATRFAINNLKAFPTEVDYIVTTAAGCGSGLHDYPIILAGTPQENAAKQLSAKTIDISSLLDKLGILAPPGSSKTIKVAYHDACHLAHAQRVRSQPRRLLRSIPGLELIEVANPEICCGSAGTYNIDQPEVSAQLGREKAASIIATGAEVLALGNIGCEVQIERYLRGTGSSIRVLHTVELLDNAYRLNEP
jgi:glycolate oxidase iron-sulfur subunit